MKVKVSEFLFYEKAAILKKQPDYFYFCYVSNMRFKGLFIMFIGLNWFKEKCKSVRNRFLCYFEKITHPVSVPRWGLLD